MAGGEGPPYPERSNWHAMIYPVDYNHSWSKGKKKWEVYMNAYVKYEKEVERLKSKQAEEKCFPQIPIYPEEQAAVVVAAANGYIVDLERALLVSGTDANGKDPSGKTPLHYAATIGYLDCVEFLIAKGADPAAKDKDGNTAYDCVVEKFGEKMPNHPLIEYFKKTGAPKK
eukprot:gnl/MRDRNA2_/MRDRNA2_96667_c0_seq1.p1 gnl/MRDRNA2_/MRDRNA2_96667_c0~~gnl/MRDRNA2_/MRDRNA2_96667_c0_seq1.p1  ORF type:complete len:197 (-),score=46.91 gnl/MRDRNA2_/MRDRNA2_96667_c0_seq1:48-560(-)